MVNKWDCGKSYFQEKIQCQLCACVDGVEVLGVFSLLCEDLQASTAFVNLHSRKVVAFYTAGREKNKAVS